MPKNERQFYKVCVIPLSLNVVAIFAAWVAFGSEAAVAVQFVFFPLWLIYAMVYIAQDMKARRSKS